MTLPEFRESFEANEPERIAFSIAHGGYSAVRAEELRMMFGIDISESTAQANQTRMPTDINDVDDAMAYLTSRKELLSGPFSPSNAGLVATAEPDDQGEQPIGYDTAAWDAAVVAANHHGVPAVGEEDEHRRLGDALGAAARGKRIANWLALGLPFAIVDPLDGSNQAAGMGQRSGWASCAMVRVPGTPGLGVAVLLGDGRGFVAGNGRVWMSESTRPDRTPIFYAIDVDHSLSGLSRAHYVIPAAKASSIGRAYAILTTANGIEYISPLGGNPGILAAMYGAAAPAAMQPTAYAWDHMAALILANGGFPVIRAHDETGLSADELTEILLTDMVAGRRTETLYMGRTLDSARYLRDADLEAQAGFMGMKQALEIEQAPEIEPVLDLDDAGEQS